ncbi:hypothetical protein LP316_12290 [Thalassotalea sp. LPB0316]|uniref:hypothetical protein n=1 Tax=Thalassotalea sp. LPB0316 TaxID=2769490 RepID=UPI00186821B7|nr:hypothetical protein [Thalassotalea sp. LPB0316]QOL25075.1 hypothetical protein LP316_12290 [Thalassotalea sp. LPB0316]
MSTIFLVVIAVSLTFIFGFMVNRFLTRNAQINEELASLKAQVQDNSVPELREEISALKKRVITLEAIVTSHGYELNDEISNL